MSVVLDSYTNFCFINYHFIKPTVLIVQTISDVRAVMMFSSALLSLNLSISISWVCSMVCFIDLPLYG
jgi:hypothetical protein